MTHAQIFADEIAALIPPRRVRRFRDWEDVENLAIILAHALGVGALTPQIAHALAARQQELEIETEGKDELR